MPEGLDVKKLDGVGPVDNTQKNCFKKCVTPDALHLTPETWPLTGGGGW